MEFRFIRTDKGLKMSEFLISLDKKEIESEGDLVVKGTLMLGDFKEDFYASLSYWDRDRYLLQWKSALERLLDGGVNSAIVTTMYDPSTANFIIWWVMYAVGGEIRVQNQILFLDELERPFDESDLYSFIPEREMQSENGYRISEWVVGIPAIKRCIDSL